MAPKGFPKPTLPKGVHGDFKAFAGRMTRVVDALASLGDDIIRYGPDYELPDQTLEGLDEVNSAISRAKAAIIDARMKIRSL
jgi:hypothetical protein